MEKKFKYKAGKTYIHESPDGGNTVYAREITGGQKHLVYQSEERLIEQECEERSHYVSAEAIKLCLKNIALQKAWEKYIVLCKLSGLDD